MTPFQLIFKTFETLLQDRQQLNQSKAKKMPVSSQRSCDSDPMEVIEKMRQMRQNRVLQRHKSGDDSFSQTLAPPPAFMRSQSNPDGGRNRSRPSSIVGNNEDNLDDMLGRVRKLREERKQILKDMAMLKDAFNDSESQESQQQQSKPFSK